jgi:Na+-transporting NADH:ubiquinone oxidoreductase subunit C
MRDFSNRYIVVFAAVMVVVVAAVLSTAAMVLQPRQEMNRIAEKKINILASVRVEASKENVDEVFDRVITDMFALNSDGEEVEGVDAFNIDLRSEQRKPVDEQLLPLFVAQPDEGFEAIIIPLEGTGLWGPIYGYIAIEDDMNTIYGINLDHQGETPGLGAEISTTWYEEKFKGKKLFDDNDFVSVKVVKGGAPSDDPHGVDAISGGTITSDGLQKMLYDNLVKYLTYFERAGNRE